MDESWGTSAAGVKLVDIDVPTLPTVSAKSLNF